MADELQALLNRIVDEELSKTEGEKERILSRAKAEAEEILSNARKEAEGIVNEAKREAGILERKGEEALKQASRDVLLSLRGALNDRLNEVALALSAKELSGESLGNVLAKLIGNFLKQNGNEDKIEVLLDEKELEVVDAALSSSLDADLRARCQLSPIGGLGAGFKLVFSGQSVVYDFSDEALAEALSSRLGARLAAILTGN